MDDLDDELLFDGDLDEDEAPDPSEAWAAMLVVNTPAETGEALNVAEEAQRQQGRRPIQFIDEDVNGAEYLSNSAEFAKLMGRDPASPVSIAEADAFIADNTAPGGQWMYWTRRGPPARSQPGP